jgi:hypothetical protein
MFALVALSALLLLVTTLTASAPISSLALAEASRRNPSLTAYSFHLDAAMAMKHFPWLHFHLAGDGEYIRGERYVVDFTQAPFFARNVKQVDLSPLDPSMWPKEYSVSVVALNESSTTFQLRKLEQDPQDTHPLVDALVTLDAQHATRDVVLHYTDGEIHLVLSPGETQGYRLPASFTADIDMPGEDLTAQANFSDYTIL